MSDTVETQLAVLNNDIKYIKESMKTISSDLKEMKGAYVPYVAFIEAKTESQKEHAEFVTKDQFKTTQDRVRTMWTGAMTFISLIVLGVLGALLNLVIKQ